jgi:diacylglycerol kinase family enzyme
MRTSAPLVVAIVGVDGCGKSSTVRGALGALAGHVRVVGIGDQVWSGGSAEPLHQRADIPHARLSQTVGRLAKGLRRPGLYKNLKFLELLERGHIREHVTRSEAPAVILTDGDPLINTAAWSVARFYRAELAGDDDQLSTVLDYLAGAATIPLRALPRYLPRAWQLVLLNWLRLGRSTAPDLIVLLELDPAVAMARIRARGRPLQAHETEAFLGDLGRAYGRVGALLHQRRGIPLLRLRVDQSCLADTVHTVVAATLEHVMTKHSGNPAAPAQPDGIDVIATTMSGSIADQRKVGRIGPAFRARTARPVRVHPAHSHTEARAIAQRLVAGGSRLLVSAGGAGTFNAVLEGAHVAGQAPADLRLAFLRKGSADLIGKVLGIPDDLPAAVAAILDGIEHDRCVGADILTVAACDPAGRAQQRQLIGFGGFGVFGEVPRFTETRLIKLYKGVLGTLFGDLGPFFVGLALATLWWQARRLLGRVAPLALVLDGAALPPTTWAGIMLLNGDLGPDFPLGRDLPLASGAFRVVALRYGGMRQALRQIQACRRGAILDRPESYAALVRTVRTLAVRPTQPPPAMINVDGLRMMTRGEVTVTVTGSIQLVAGPRSRAAGAADPDHARAADAGVDAQPRLVHAGQAPAGADHGPGRSRPSA